MEEAETKTLVTISEFLSPINFPKKPATMDATNGRNNIAISIYPFRLFISSTRIVDEFR